jgi:two-component system chemotaxis response regulator CheY
MTESPTMRILVVDDTLAMRTTIKSMLGKLGYTDIIEAINGLDAWDKISTSPTQVGLVLCDQNMPECTGIEFLKKLRADSKLSKTPFLMVTSEGDRSFLLEVLKAGAHDIAIKPITQEILSDKIQNALKRAAG